MSSKGSKPLSLDQYLAGNSEIINTVEMTREGFITPHQDNMDQIEDENSRPNLSLFEIPSNYQAMKTEDMELAISWRMYTRAIFELYFYNGYIVTDFVYQSGKNPRSLYVLSHGDAKIGLSG